MPKEAEAPSKMTPFRIVQILQAVKITISMKMGNPNRVRPASTLSMIGKVVSIQWMDTGAKANKRHVV
jgi:hypothetical protein